MYSKSYKNAVETRAIIDVLQALVLELTLPALQDMSHREKEEYFHRVEINASTVTPGSYDLDEKKFFEDVAAEASIQSRKYTDLLRSVLSK